MRPITLKFTLLTCLHLLSGTAGADSGGGWTWPVRGPVITGYRNGSDPYAAGQHRGVDIGAPVGTRVVAAASGQVTFVGVVGSSGLTVSERTSDGRFDLSYLHLDSAAVHRGDPVTAGDGLGAVGTSGQRSAEAPHLHFGVREAGSHTAYRDPLDFLAPPPAGSAPEPTPVPVPVAHPAAPEPAPSAASVPALPALPAPTPSGVPALSSPPHPAPGHAPGVPAQRAEPMALTGAALPALLDPRSAGPPALPSRAGHTHEAGRAAEGPGAAPSPHTRASSASGPATTAAPHGPAALEASASPGHAASAEPHAAHPSHHGIDVGWLAACLGLVAAATALGHPDGTRKLAARGHARIGAVLRPVSRGS